jgi:hypothetical protein
MNYQLSAALRKEVGKQLKAKRLQRDEQRKAVAASTGIEYTVLCKIESGTYDSLNLHTIKILIQYYQEELVIKIS